jgi:hypothetical protein
MLSVVRNADEARNWFGAIYAQACDVRRALGEHVATPSPFVVCMRFDGSWAEAATLQEAEAIFAMPYSMPPGAIAVPMQGRHIDTVEGGERWHE